MSESKKFTYRYNKDTENLLLKAEKSYMNKTLSGLINRLILEAVIELPAKINKLEKDKRELNEELNSLKNDYSRLEFQYNELKHLVKQRKKIDAQLNSLTS